MLRISSPGAAERRPASRGFTLIEVMITVAIVGILTAIALPAYMEQVARGRRADVQAALLQDAQYMQRYYAAYNTYANVTAAIKPVLPRPTSPVDTAAVAYNIAVTTNTDAGFTLTATGTGSMASDKCNSYTYDNLDQKGPASTRAACWR